MMGKTKAGRKRRTDVGRHKCGKIIKADRARTPIYTPAAIAQRLKLGATMANVLDQRWGSELGILSMRKQITDEMYRAGVELASLAEGYVALGGFGSFNARAADPDRVRGYSDKLGDPDVWRDVKADYELAVATVKTITFGLCVHDWPADARMVSDDLARLAKLWHLDTAAEDRGIRTWAA